MINDLTIDEQKLVMLWRSMPDSLLEVRFKKGKISYMKEHTQNFIDSVPLQNYDLLPTEVEVLSQARHVYYGTLFITVYGGIPDKVLSDSYRTYIFSSDGRLDIE